MSWLLDGDDDGEYELLVRRGRRSEPVRPVESPRLSQAGVSMLGPDLTSGRRTPRDEEHGRLGVLRHCLEPVERLLGPFTWDDAAMNDVPDHLTRRLQEWVREALAEHHRMMDAAAVRAVEAGVGVLARYDERGILVSAVPDERVPFLEVWEVRGSGDVDVDELLEAERVARDAARLEAEDDDA